MSSPADEQEAQTDENVHDLLIIGAWHDRRGHCA